MDVQRLHSFCKAYMQRINHCLAISKRGIACPGADERQLREETAQKPPLESHLHKIVPNCFGMWVLRKELIHHRSYP